MVSTASDIGTSAFSEAHCYNSIPMLCEYGLFCHVYFLCLDVTIEADTIIKTVLNVSEAFTFTLTGNFDSLYFMLSSGFEAVFDGTLTVSTTTKMYGN